MNTALLHRPVLLILSLFSLATASDAWADTETTADSIAIATTGNPASLVVFDAAQATAVLADGTVLGARALPGKGRVTAIGHGGFLSDTRPDTRKFILNELLWLADNKPQRAWGIPKVFQDALIEKGIDLTIVGGAPDNLVLSSVDLIVGSPQSFARAGRLEDLRAWLEAGGALMSVETAWGQLQLGHAADVDDLAANKFLTAHGIMYTSRALSPNREGLYPLDASINPLANAEQALRILTDEQAPNRVLAARIVRTALAIVPLDSTLIQTADQLRAKNSDELTQAYESMAQRPLKLTEQPLASALLDLESRRAAIDPSSAVAHPSAAAFPGAVPDSAPRLTQELTLSTTIPGWRSTALYAAPGETVTVRVASEPIEGLTAQIGAWLDPQNFDDRHRMPRAHIRVPMTTPQTKIASPIGGPLYIDLPTTLPPDQTITLEISGVIEMPRFRLDHTDLTEWNERIRTLSAPWAELESDELVFTIPAKDIRNLDRPDLVMQHWDRVHQAMQDLEPRSPRHWPDRQYRYVAEKKLSWGYMYCPSDAPIVIPTTAAHSMVNLENFDNQGPNELWGHYHEMGHSHQNPMWTFAGTGEVTVNIFTVLALNTVNDYPLDFEGMRTTPAKALATMTKHYEADAPYDQWKSDPFLALQTYALLWHQFGWDAFRQTFRAYDTLKPHEQPKNDQEKRDQFVLRMSKEVGHNLYPYFTAWGVPISKAVEEELKELPAWLPKGFEP